MNVLQISRNAMQEGRADGPEYYGTMMAVSLLWKVNPARDFDAADSVKLREALHKAP
ncbi:hypothetical protein JQ543_14385 [Bradyrhizobium diazoefficiens]|nr:hypothetical protein [Bradyrhizobium diazoefficiens]MBR0848936.1 hypothetical protein [Bradyrhizobium diazoefficiens]